MRLVAAVDGPAGSGKSSVCRKTALDLGMQYIDSGAIYRAITLYFLENTEIPALSMIPPGNLAVCIFCSISCLTVQSLPCLTEGMFPVIFVTRG